MGSSSLHLEKTEASPGVLRSKDLGSHLITCPQICLLSSVYHPQKTSHETPLQNMQGSRIDFVYYLSYTPQGYHKAGRYARRLFCVSTLATVPSTQQVINKCLFSERMNQVSQR